MQSKQQSRIIKVKENLMNKAAIVSITDRAAERIKHLLENRGKESQGIKVLVESGGCSGLKYKIEYADEISKYDEVVEKDNIKVIIDPKAVLHLIGSEIDYVEEKLKSGFTFTNPNEKGRCGCGESFTT